MTPINDYVAKLSRAWERPSWWNLLIVLPWAIGLVLIIGEWRTDVQVAKRQQTTSGTVTTHEPANHNQYVYKFEVSGTSYTGRQSPKGDELSLGKQVVVFYDPQNPSKNALSDFHDVSTSALGPVPMLCFGIGALTVFIFYRRRRTPPRKHLQ